MKMDTVSISKLLDLSCLKSFVVIAQTGSISSASTIVHLSQSAVSLQIKRLEDTLNTKLFTRKSKGIVLTKAGYALLPLAKDLLEMNNNIINYFSDSHMKKPILLGVPHDVVHPCVPKAIRIFNNKNPTDIQIVLQSSQYLWDAYDRCDLDMIITTDVNKNIQSTILTTKKIIWVSAYNSLSISQKPLPVIFNKKCIIKDISISSLVDSEIDYHLIESFIDVNEILAAVAADQGIHALIEDKCPDYLEDISNNLYLPKLSDLHINLTYNMKSNNDIYELANCLQEAFIDN